MISKWLQIDFKKTSKKLQNDKKASKLPQNLLQNYPNIFGIKSKQSQKCPKMTKKLPKSWFQNGSKTIRENSKKETMEFKAEEMHCIE